MSGPEEINNTEQVKESAILANQLAGFTAHCRNGQDAPCMGACPYRLDVRGFLEKAARGSFRGAYNILQDTLLFPKTLCAICGHACRDACAPELDGEYIDLPAIERAVIENAPRKGAKRFRVPPKEEKIAVIGAGLSGMSAAYYLSSVGYTVTIYEKEDASGGALKGILPEEVYLPEFTDIAGAGNIGLAYNREIKGIGELDGFAGVIIATGAEGSVPLSDDRAIPDHGKTGLFQNGNVFVIGQAAGAPLTSSVSFGKMAGTAMDRYLKAGEIAGAGGEHVRTQSVSPVSLTPSADRLDRDAAAKEAQRCRMCDCTKCVEVCELMKHYNKVPPRFEIDIPGTLNAAENIRKRSATRLLMSCDDCRMCESACPEGIRTGNALMQVRTAMAHDMVLPAAFHDFWIRDMLFSCSAEAEYLKEPGNGFLYFPGCLLGASDPGNVTGSFSLLEEILPGCGICLSCCGIPAKWAGETKLLEENSAKIHDVWEKCGKPVFITACPSCRRNLKELLPEIEVRSIYKILAEHKELFSEDILAGEKLAVFHPCSSHFDPEEQESVNRLIRFCGGDVKELEDPSDRNGCCGYGGHIYYTNQSLYDKISARRAASDERPYITYCANCRDVLKEKGKDTSHILRVLADKKRIESSVSTLSERRENRKKLKALLSGEPLKDVRRKMVISEDLACKMDRSLILDSDVEAVIRHCEETGRYLINEEGAYIGHLKIGIVTYWVFWEKEGDIYNILNTYNHRMTIIGEQQNN